MAGTIATSQESRIDVFYIIAIALFILAGAVVLGSWDLLSSVVSKEVQDYLIGGLIGFCVCLLGLGAYSAVSSHRLHRDLINEKHRLKAAQEKAAEMPE